jgi:hypothetical protein
MTIRRNLLSATSVLAVFAGLAMADPLSGAGASLQGNGATPGLWRTKSRAERFWLLAEDPSVARREIREIESLNCRVDVPRPEVQPATGVRGETVFNGDPVTIWVGLRDDSDSQRSVQAAVTNNALENNSLVIERGDRSTEYWVTTQLASGWSPNLPYEYHSVHSVRLGACPNGMKIGDSKRVSCKLTGAVDWNCD